MIAPGQSSEGRTLEMERLCACIRPPELAASLPEDGRRWVELDWPRFLELATNHHVIPLVYRTLKSAAKEENIIPSQWLDYLRSLNRSIAAHNVRALSLLSQLQTLLSSAGIPSVPVKGPSLALLAYNDLSRRQFEDLDILVLESDLLHALDLLATAGYSLRELSKRTSRLRYLKTLQNWSLHKTGCPPVDLKPVIASHTLSRPGDVRFMLEACQPLSIGDGRQLSAPGPEAMLLAVCLDGANEMWFKLSSVADVAALLTTFPDADWEGLLLKAAHMGQRRSLLVGVQVAASLTGMTLPSVFQNEVWKDRTVQRLALRAVNWICSEPSRQTSIFRQSRFGLQTRERMADRIRFVRRLLFVPGPFELNALPLPDALYPLYALFRPARLAWDVWGRGGRHRRLSIAASKLPALRKAVGQ